MPKPQQPELRRSGKGDTDRDGKELRVDEDLEAGDAPIGPVPEDNQPGNRPERDQDKPPPPDA